MFLSYATVPFTILLNFFFLYSPIEMAINGMIYDTCQECLDDICHHDLCRPCISRSDGGYFCFTCDPENGNQQFYSEDECNKGCTDKKNMSCVCTDACFVCIANEDIGNANLEKCNLLTKEELNVTCK
ncbi:uncharacterized protein LOC100575848 [Acyrthosiphon pisum]|uniref:ACYPI008667 protein n=1 Tax=Acyrthosiphon pisum TaxID=7029 RepID=A0A8R2AAC4_ACYPI|nr:uncharacterized protein LOC100575848 [Acyrthosiphon pisum]|eukprot:XP_003242391.1 PREDICTED: uncharacterized protein LOC100575848 [Acyrthosiphon pisum]